MYVAVKGGERAIANAHALLADVAARRPRRRRDRAGADRRAACAGGRPRDERGLALRSRARRAGDQAGARRPDRGDLPAARLSHHACRASASPSRSTPARWRRAGASRRPSRICRAARCSARPSTTPIACSTSRSPRPRDPPRAGDRAGRRGDDDAARRRHPRRRRPDRAQSGGRRRRRRSPTSRASRSSFPPRATRGCRTWRAATRAFCSALGYSTQRGYGRNHPVRRRNPLRRGRGRDFVAETRLRRRRSATITLTECQMVNQFKGGDGEPPHFTRGYGLAFGQSERKAMSMALVDRALRADELGEDAHRRRRRTRNSCCRTPTTCRRPASSSI